MVKLLINNIKIGRIQIQNFKHIENLILDFSNKELVVLDGPNGFGKTTVFDAIELVLTGKISRIKNTADGRYGYSDVLFSNKSDSDTEIKVEFVGDDDKFVIAKKIDSQKELTPSERKPDNWEIFDTYILSDFDTPINKGKSITVEEIGQRLSLDNLNRYFSLFYYVQQEENTLFLKQSAKERMDEISQLFDTYNEEIELKKLKDIKSKVDVETRRLDGQTGVIAEKRKTLNAFTAGIKDINQEDLKEVEYFCLIPKENNVEEWDKQEVSLNKDSREKFLKELREIYVLVRDLKSFTNTNFNDALYKYIENGDLIYNTVLTYKLIGDYERIKRLKDKEKILIKMQKTISKDNLGKSLTVTHFKEIEKLLDIKLDISTMEKYLNDLVSYKMRMGEVSEIVQNLNSTRETFVSQFNKIKSESDEGDCPLCGTHFKSYVELIKAIDHKSKKFSTMYDETTKRYETLYNNFFSSHVNIILLEIEKYLTDGENIIDDVFYKRFISAMENKNAILEFFKWCTDNKLNIDPFLNSRIEMADGLDNRVQGIVEYLLLQIRPVDESYSNHEINNSTFNRIFNSDLNKVSKVTLEQIINKVAYINYKYYYRSSENIKALEKEIHDLTIKLDKMKLFTKKIKISIEVYEQEIINHWKKIITDIEIPFYIYSGKIIQAYQRGCGLFIYENESFGQKSIRFVSDIKSNHDAINYLSSGQISGLVIAFTLALNKVYEENSIDVLMIDDPVQTMDEINMASLVELLRNEFGQKQIILSTHEQETSRYIRYKFSKYNLNTMKVNIKDAVYRNALDK